MKISFYTKHVVKNKTKFLPVKGVANGPVRIFVPQIPVASSWFKRAAQPTEKYPEISEGMTEEEMMEVALHRPLTSSEMGTFHQKYPEWF